MSSKCPPDLACVLQVSPASSRFLKCPPTFSSVLCPGLGPRTLGSICPFWSRECPPNVLRIWLVSSRFLQRPPGFSSVLQLSPSVLCPGLRGHYLPRTGTSGGYPTGHCQDNAQGWEDNICPEQEPLGLSNWTLSDNGQGWEDTVWPGQGHDRPSVDCPDLGGHRQAWEDTICPEQEPLGLSNWTLSGQCPGLGGHCLGMGGHYLPGTATFGVIQLDAVRAMPRAGRTLSRPGRTLFAQNRNLGLSNWTLSGQCPGLGGQYLPGTGTSGAIQLDAVRQWPGLGGHGLAWPGT